MIEKKTVCQIVEEWLEGKDYFLVEVTVSPDDKIVVEIDHAEGVWIEDCVELSRYIESKLNREEEDYELEVGSAGIGQPFKVLQQYYNHIGLEVEVLTKGGRKLSGVLKDADEEKFVVTVQKKVKPEGAKRPQLVEEDETFTYDDIKYTLSLYGRLNDIYHYIMGLDVSNNVDIGFDCDCNSQSDSLISCIVQNLVHTGNRYEMAISGSPTGKESANLYYENLDSVIESVYTTVSKSDLALYKGNVYFFTGKIYEIVPGHAYLKRAMRTYLRVSGVPKAFIVRSIKDIMAEMYNSLEINRVLRPRYNVMAFENGVVDMRDGVLRPFSRDHHVIYLHRYRYDPEAKCPKWHSFLRGTEFGKRIYSGGVLPDKNDRTILQMFLGLSLYDRGTMDKKVENALVLFGNGSNGKSVIMDTVMGILGEAMSVKEIYPR